MEKWNKVCEPCLEVWTRCTLSTLYILRRQTKNLGIISFCLKLATTSTGSLIWSYIYLNRGEFPDYRPDYPLDQRVLGVNWLHAGIGRLQPDPVGFSVKLL